jgi:hypothetical protein
VIRPGPQRVCRLAFSNCVVTRDSGVHRAVATTAKVCSELARKQKGSENGMANAQRLCGYASDSSLVPNPGSSYLRN